MTLDALGFKAVYVKLVEGRPMHTVYNKNVAQRI